MYYHEIEQKNYIVSRISILSGLISILIGAAIYYFTNMQNIVDNLWGKVFYISFVIFIILLLVAVYYLAEAYQGIKQRYNYAYLPAPMLIHQYTLELEEFHKNEKNKEKIIKDKLNRLLYNAYLEAAEHNRELNFRKIGKLHRCGLFFILSLIFCGLTIIPYSIAESKPPINIKIENISDIKKEVNTMADKKEEDNKVKPEPIPPKVEYIWEGAEKKFPSENK